jgi:hypothetical protein
VELGEYNMMLPEGKYQCSFANGIVTVSRNNDVVVLEYPISSIVRKDTMLLHHPDHLLTYRNDSLMLVLESVSIGDTAVTEVGCYNYQLFKKKAK